MQATERMVRSRGIVPLNASSPPSNAIGPSGVSVGFSPSRHIAMNHAKGIGELGMSHTYHISPVTNFHVSGISSRASQYKFLRITEWIWPDNQLTHKGVR